jgi:hypothetical protein
MTTQQASPETKREAYCQEYVRSGGKLQQSALAAGYGTTGAGVRANELMKDTRVTSRIEEILRDRFVTEGLKAHQVILNLSKKSSPANAVQLRAAKELMVLGGMFKKASEAAHAADAATKSKAELAGMCQAFADGMQHLFCLDSPSTGSQTGIKHVAGVYTITDAERAGEWLTKLHSDWTQKLPGQVETRPNLYLPPDEDLVQDEETEDDEWVAQ